MDTADAAQNVDLQKGLDGAPPEQDKDTKPFSPEQEQFMKSWFGRIVSTQLEEKVLPRIEEMRQPVQPPPDMSAFKDEVYHQAVVDGDFAGAVEKVFNKLQGKRSSANEALNKEVDKFVVSYSEDPDYKDIYSDMNKRAHELKTEGYPPIAAAKQAFTEAKLSYLQRPKDLDDDGSLDMSAGGGRPKPRKKKVVLPEHFKKAMARDIGEGRFKTEEEWISYLSPQIKRELGIL